MVIRFFIITGIIICLTLVCNRPSSGKYCTTGPNGMVLCADFDFSKMQVVLDSPIAIFNHVEKIEKREAGDYTYVRVAPFGSIPFRVENNRIIEPDGIWEKK